MKKPALVIMAAGAGSRFGGLKQITAVDEQGHIIIDFSLYDAWRAGFRDLYFIIKPELESTFREVIGDRMSPYFHITYIHQTLDKLPAGYQVPAGRTKPWGTGHAILCCQGSWISLLLSSMPMTITVPLRLQPCMTTCPPIRRNPVMP